MERLEWMDSGMQRGCVQKLWPVSRLHFVTDTQAQKAEESKQPQRGTDVAVALKEDPELEKMQCPVK